MSALPLRDETDWDCMERIVGPVHGYWLALYAAPAPGLPGHYDGYFKICAQQPESYFEGTGLLKGGGDAARRHPILALHDAEQAGLLAAGNLPAPHRLGAWKESRPLNVYELDMLGARTVRR